MEGIVISDINKRNFKKNIKRVKKNVNNVIIVEILDLFILGILLYF